MPTEIPNDTETPEIEFLDSMTVEAERELPKEFLVLLKKVSYYLARVGLSREEACMLSNYDSKLLESEMKQHPVVHRIVVTMELLYKKDLLRSISAKARGGDHKLAMWLLSQKFPLEFGSTKHPDGNPIEDPFLQAMTLIREGGVKKDPIALPENAQARNIIDI